MEQLEARNLLNGTPLNVLVNNPAEDTTVQDTQSETALVLGAGSNIVSTFNDSSTWVPGVSNHATGYSLSTNRGASFADQGTLPASPGGDAGDSVLARSSKTGTIFLSTLITNATFHSIAQEKTNIFRSIDNGASFGLPVNGTPGFTAGVDQQDKPWIAVDNYRGPGFGNVYLVWTDFSASGPKAIFLTRSTDDGLTWGPSGGTPIATPGPNGVGNFQGAYVTVGPDHAVYVFWWDLTKGPAILMRKSTDQGQTFGDSMIVTGLKTHHGDGDLGLTPFRSNAYPQAAVNPVTGDIFVVYDDQANGSADKADVFFTESTDGGKHWSKPLRVNDDATNNDQWQPALAMTPDGKEVGIFWYDRRLDPANNLIDRFGVIGDVSGSTVTFRPNFRITDVSFPPASAQDPAVTFAYMGDYDQAVADNNYFYTTWGDNRLGDAFHANQPDVRFAKIPVSEDETASLALVLSSNTVPGTSPAALSIAQAGGSPMLSAAAAAGGGGGATPVGDSLAAAAAFALPLPGQAVTLLPAVTTPNDRAAPALARQAIDQFFTAIGRKDGGWAFAPAKRHAQDGTEDSLGDVLSQAPWWQDPEEVFAPTTLGRG